MTNINFKQIQGLVFRGYGYMQAARYLFLTIHDAGRFKNWLSQNLDSFTMSDIKPKDKCINIGFTYEGLKKIGLSDTVLDTFSDEFRDAVISEHKLRLLGDEEKNAPCNWQWGFPEEKDGKTKDGITYENLHVWLGIFTPDEMSAEKETERLQTEGKIFGFTVFSLPPTAILPDKKEHFGFRDGISQPGIEGHTSGKNDPVKAGEFVLGYENEYKIFPLSPFVNQSDDFENLLDFSERQDGKKDLGKNGTYLVFRQLEEDVKSFWEFVFNKAQAHSASMFSGNPDLLAAKLMGRWRNGAPIVLSPEKDDPNLSSENNFLYTTKDPEGQLCPIGAHIRRANPRDAFKEDPKKSLLFTKKHRILRRSRAYGQPLDANLEPKKMLESSVQDTNRGIFFIAINANLGRQFEFVQQTWINDPKFLNFYNEPDALIGNSNMEKDNIETKFTVPEKCLRTEISGTGGFVRTRGSAYFFLPSLNSLKFLTLLP